MRIAAARVSIGTGRFWRPKLAVAVSIALVIQNALVVILAAHLAASAVADAVPGVELCLHSTNNVPPPVDVPGGHDDQHCLSWCLAAHHSLAATVDVSYRPLALHASGVLSTIVIWRLPLFAKYSIARPRGPPLSA
jgi:hypothetical protein